MLENLQVVTGKPVDMSIRISLLEEIPRSSSFLLPLNLWHEKVKKSDFMVAGLKNNSQTLVIPGTIQSVVQQNYLMITLCLIYEEQNHIRHDCVNDSMTL